MRHVRAYVLGFLGLACLAVVATFGPAWRARNRPASAPAPLRIFPVSLQASPDPFEGAVAWLNCGGPIKLKELRGKVVLLDFWTYCCINCHHVLPDLAKLEEKYKNELVVIGVHTPKFFAEQDTENIRSKVREYRIKHPIISDANMTIWNRFGVQSWPTLVVLDTEGKPVGAVSGEGNFAVLDRVIGELVEKARAAKSLDETPVKFFAENEKPDNTPLLFPGKVLADAAGRRLFIADTGHNRVVMTDLEGKSPVVIGNGGTGLTDGPYDKAAFNRPQGMCLVGDTLYVADTENHAIRAVDLAAKTVATVAGTGAQAREVTPVGTKGPAKKTELNSPWDLAHVGEAHTLYIAMAGTHQIWKLDLAAGTVSVFAGTGAENIVDGPAALAKFAQPSGLATDGTHLYVADSEVSALRSILLTLGKHPVQSIVGQGLFEFGDKDGKGTAVRLQHCLGVAFGGGKLYVADTYNNKVKVSDPGSRAVRSLVGTGKPGETDKPAEFYQPGGLSVAGNTLYVADTNNHKIRVVDLAGDTVSTLSIESLSPPVPPARRPAFPNAKSLAVNAKQATLAPGGKTVALTVTLPLEPGYKLNAEAPMPYVVDSVQPGVVAYSPEFPETGRRVAPPTKQFAVEVPLVRPGAAGMSLHLKLSVAAFVCNEGSNLCTIKSFVWTVPVSFADDGAAAVSVGK